MEQFNSGELKNIFRINSQKIPSWSDDRWKTCLAAGRRAKKRYQYCTDVSGIIVYLQALQRHSRRDLIDLSLQDNVVIPSGFLQQINHIGCALNLHPIINNRLIPGSQNSSKIQYSSFLLILWTKIRRILKRLTWVYHVVHNTCITHGRKTKTWYIGSTSTLLLRKDWNSIRIDRMQLSFKWYFRLIVF